MRVPHLRDKRQQHARHSSKDKASAPPSLTHRSMWTAPHPAAATDAAADVQVAVVVIVGAARVVRVEAGVRRGVGVFGFLHRVHGYITRGFGVGLGFVGGGEGGAYRKVPPEKRRRTPVHHLIVSSSPPPPPRARTTTQVPTAPAGAARLNTTR